MTQPMIRSEISFPPLTQIHIARVAIEISS